MKKAFTLIELLVVIAIIAILAAILFPVFTQAKVAAKRTQTLSNYKQTGTASAVYLSNSDDVYPLSMRFNSVAGTWWNASYAAVPNGSTTSGARNVEPRKSEEGIVFHNAIQPYMKSYDLFEASGMPLSPVFTDATAFRAKVGSTYNGFLHGYSSTAVENVAAVPVIWGGQGKQNLGGATIADPQLSCGGPTCGYSAGLPSSSDGGIGSAPSYGYAWFLVGSSANFSAWMYDQSNLFAYADTHAKTVTQAAPKWPSYALGSVNNQPYSAMDPGNVVGSPYWMIDCRFTPTSVAYAGYFMPDKPAKWDAAQCDHGGGFGS